MTCFRLREKPSKGSCTLCTYWSKVGSSSRSDLCSASRFERIANSANLNLYCLGNILSRIFETSVGFGSLADGQGFRIAFHLLDVHPLEREKLSMASCAKNAELFEVYTASRPHFSTQSSLSDNTGIIYSKQPFASTNQLFEVL